MSSITARRWLAAFTLSLTAVAAACNGSPTAPDPGPTQSTGLPPALAPLTINITDSPFSDARALLVTFTDVGVHRADTDSWQSVPFTAGTSRTCDLEKLTGPVDVLGVGSLPVGKYTQVRLVVSEARLYFDNPSVGPACAPSIIAPAGASAVVEIPSGKVMLNHPFTLAIAGSTMLLDFDGDQSVKQTGGDKGNGSNAKYIMTPVIRVVSVS